MHQHIFALLTSLAMLPGLTPVAIAQSTDNNRNHADPMEYMDSMTHGEHLKLSSKAQPQTIAENPSSMDNDDLVGHAGHNHGRRKKPASNGSTNS